MSSERYLHDHPEFPDLIRAVAAERNIDPYLAEKDYWIMHCLYGLKQAGYDFQLKGGTSLSKGFGIIHRFSEDIDIHIAPPASLKVRTSANHNKEKDRQSRKEFYDHLAREIKIPGIVKVERDTTFDSPPKYFSGGIRLYYEPAFPSDGTAKDGVLLEAGFDDVIPNHPIDIGSWALGFALDKGVDVIDNKALQIPCYDSGYTLVEKLQTIATKFRNQKEGKEFPANFLRHYYDVFCLLQNAQVQKFIGSEAYEKHKAKRFPKADQKFPLRENEAFLLRDPENRALYTKEFERRPGLYYQGQPSFEEILAVIQENLDRL
ncbi:nucleotidyl transferase AbiEii/AbiGii toxin family protein [Nitrospina watsonii]|uniref:Nucleotidyl transferase AbiEii/AbiGii toxin family protein n=1 Tax=Nitrospina watsonii TaxID=1323948 RepID=A0ABM9HBP8_9BACT|nr:nucleotidyl transferase AbiEii/AbiGii toxin family protein [Nitrospina watsonii]CAI2717537.1 conserved protein of unknown function [Nitrospina watsonii]